MDKRSYNKRQVGTEKENLAAEVPVMAAVSPAMSRSNTGRMAEAEMR